MGMSMVKYFKIFGYAVFVFFMLAGILRMIISYMNGTDEE